MKYKSMGGECSELLAFIFREVVYGEHGFQAVEKNSMMHVLVSL